MMPSANAMAIGFEHRYRRIAVRARRTTDDRL